jgi:hypothetical protein
MTIKKLQWRPFLDRLSQFLGTKQAEIEVAALNVGDQIEAEWVPFLGITYDPNDDIVEVALEGLDHLINKPREIYFDEDVGGGIAGLEIVTADGEREIVKLRDPLMLPAPTS